MIGTIYILLLAMAAWAGIELTLLTLVAKVMTKNWWWHRTTNQDWELKFGANSWSFNGAGTSPMDTVKKLWSDLSGKNVSVKEIIKDEIDNEIRHRTKYAVKKAVSHKTVARKVSRMITEEIEKQLNE